MEGLIQSNIAETPPEDYAEALDAVSAAPSATEDKSAGGHELKGDPPDKPSGASSKRIRGPKRRTKTGCLTCRKRRIKCGEEKPRCNNCIKAKRECEGYTQPVIFKNPLGTFSTFQSASLFGQNIRPMRVPPDVQQQGKPVRTPLSGSQPRLLAPRMPNFLPGVSPPLNELYGQPPSSSSSSQTIQNERDQVAISQPYYYPSHLQTTSAQSLPTPTPEPTPFPYSSLNVPGPSNLSFDPVSSVSSIPAGQLLQTDDLSSADLSAHARPTPLELPTSLMTDAEAVHSLYYSQPQQMPHALHDNVIPQPMAIGNPLPTPLDTTSSNPLLQYQPGYYELEDDEYYDVDSDEEMEYPTASDGLVQLNAIMSSGVQDPRLMRSFTTYLNEPNILASYRPSMSSSPLNNPKTARIWVHFIHATGPSLSMWERHHTSPIMIFSGSIPSSQQGLWTYIMPLKSLEHPALLHAILAISSLHIAKLQQAPLTISLKHYQYAIRRIAKAVGLPVPRRDLATLAATLTLGFYEVVAADHSKWNNHVSGAAQLIKEINIGQQTRDLRAYRRAVRAYRIQMAQLDPWFDITDLYGGEDDPFADREMDIDPHLISTLLGREVDFDLLGRIDTVEELRARKVYWTPKDIENFRIQTDLYWWFVKQDLFQSLISGNSLYLPVDRLAQCPPRGGLGKREAIYASFDHLVLLLARLTDFGVRDRKRKIRCYEPSGGEWRPHPGFFKFMGRFGKGPPGSQRPPGVPPGGYPSDHPRGPPPPATTFVNPGDASGPPPGIQMRGSFTGASHFPSSGPPSSQGSGTTPSTMRGDGISPQSLEAESPMYGMMPSKGPAPPPAPFIDARDRGHSPPKDSSELEATEAEAEGEWEEIRKAFDVYFSSLGSAFKPLPADSAPPVSTPFGPALQYRSHQIAVLWAFYYLGKILLYRMHPSMPPAAMVAATVAASVTEEDAQRVGRIAAGVYYPQRSNLEAGSLNPTLGAALTEITVTIFFAAVQFTDAVQRGWTVAKLRNIARLTGWQTAAAIATGCEASWYNQHKKGKGPAYEKRWDIRSDPVDEDTPHLIRSGQADAQNEINPANERRFVRVSKAVRTHWAMGVLEMESDLVNLSLED